MKPSTYKPWIVGGLVFLIGVWLTRPPKANFLRIPGRGAAPDWAFNDLDGRRYAATNFTGQIVILNFWATWCPPCLRELPDLAAFHRAHSTQGVTVIGASIDEPPEPALRSFLKRSTPPYPVVVADALSREAFGGISQVPETWVIDRQGRVAARYLGALSREELERAVAPLLTNAAAGPTALP